MVHVVTVHWNDERWVDIQLSFLRRHVSGTFKMYAFLNGLPAAHRQKYFYASTEPIRSHAVKLNLLADIASFNATSADDWLLFIDGDAFPIADIAPFASRMFERYPLMAVQRRENGGDRQPHPSFCLTTVGFWKQIHGDWKEGYTWTGARGEAVSDVGGNLLGILERRNIAWHPMLRSNRTNLHPLLFGLYDDLVYHHGFGFRRGMSRAGREELNHRTSPVSRAVGGALALLPREGVLGRIRMTLSPRERVRLEVGARDARLSQDVFESIQRDPAFYRRFQ